jgi:pumilio family protein 6
MTTKIVKVLDPALPPVMSSAVFKAINSEDAGGAENVIRIACAAPFVMVELLAALEVKGQKQLVKILGTDEAKERIGASKASGVGLLVERIEAL